jgi:hypothetical protein
LLRNEVEADVLAGGMGKLLRPLTDEEFRLLAEQAMHRTLDRVMEEG